MSYSRIKMNRVSLLHTLNLMVLVAAGCQTGATVSKLAEVVELLNVSYDPTVTIPPSRFASRTASTRKSSFSMWKTRVQALIVLTYLIPRSTRTCRDPVVGACS